MDYRDFYYKLKRKFKGIQQSEAFRLWKEGGESAEDAHRELFEADEIPGVYSEYDFKAFCCRIGAEHVLDNIGYDGDESCAFHVSVAT